MITLTSNTGLLWVEVDNAVMLAKNEFWYFVAGDRVVTVVELEEAEDD